MTGSHKWYIAQKHRICSHPTVTLLFFALFRAFRVFRGQERLMSSRFLVFLLSLSAFIY